MAAPYLYHDPKNPPPLKEVLIAFVVIIILGAIFVKCTDNHQFRNSGPNNVSAAPTHGTLHGNDAAVEAPTSAEIKAVMKDARRSVSNSSPMNVASADRPKELTEGFSFTGMHRCTVMDYRSLQSVLEVSFATEGAFGFALASTTGPAPTAYSMPTLLTENVGIIGFNNPDLRRLYVALSGSPEVNNGWKVLGFVDLPAPISVDWCGYSGVFQLTRPDGRVQGRVHVSTHDPNEDLLLFR